MYRVTSNGTFFILKDISRTYLLNKIIVPMYSFSKSVVSYFVEKKYNFFEYGTSHLVIGIITTSETSNGCLLYVLLTLITNVFKTDNRVFVSDINTNTCYLNRQTFF